MSLLSSLYICLIVWVWFWDVGVCDCCLASCCDFRRGRFGYDFLFVVCGILHGEDCFQLSSFTLELGIVLLTFFLDFLWSQLPGDVGCASLGSLLRDFCPAPV